MPSPRLRLWQVLRDEYELFHDVFPFTDLEPEFWLLTEHQLKHPQLALCVHSHSNPVTLRLFNELDEDSRRELSEFGGSGDLPPKLRADILAGLNNLLRDDDFYKLYDEAAVEEIVAEASPVLDEEASKRDPLYARRHPLVKRWLLEETFANEIVSIDESLTTKCYRAIHKENHSALCLSGGGIRSATFNLGLLQGLARHGLLEKFDYLSTVSGGGFSGGWLSAWIKRHPEGLDGVVRDLGKEAPTAQKPLEPESEPLSWLRSYSNFLSPKLGLFSSDTWTIVATVLRNIFLNWLVFVPVLMAALMLPRLWAAFVNRRTFEGAEDFSIGIGFIAGMAGLLYIALNLPAMRRRNRGQTAFLLRCLLPLLISAMALATYGMRVFEQRIAPDFVNFVFYQIGIILAPWIAAAFYQFKIRRRSATASKLVLNFLLATLVILIAQIVTAWLLWKAAAAWVAAPDTVGNHLLYICFAVPFILAILSLTGILLAGLTSNYTDDEDQEWWARAGAWVFIAIIGWSALCVLVIYGPTVLTNLFGGLPEKLSHGNIFSKEVLAALGAIISGVITISGGFSSKTPANDQEEKKAGLGGKLLGLLLNVAALVFLIFIISALALLTNLLMVSLFPGPWLGAAGERVSLPPHSTIILQSPTLLLVVTTIILIALGAFLGRLINTNKFSLHYLWRNRIIRAYLGASNFNRRPNSFTGFDGNDNLRMHELKPTGRKKLLHVLNFALNLVGGDKLAWQERKAESFTASPLHCGNYRLGYRRAVDYGGRVKPGDAEGKCGISLGTSIAISGAFVSPNMGYMQSSPVIRFLMTLFNVRFGWWLGNPGRAGEGVSDLTRTYDLNGPRLSIKPIVKEALGMTNDRSDYVYLSDGGHFENFGLYEMVLRRCRLVVVGDATSDAEYSFESLGQSLRKIRIDFGIPIEFKKFLITKPSRDERGVYAAIGSIKYHCIDGGSPEATDGTLILIKPTLLGDETRDVLNYASQSGSFPQEFIGDQWFSESQFESYRALGSHIVDALCREERGKINDRNTFDDLNKFRQCVEDNLGPKPAVDPDR
ncbi:MAG TPA: patatin-like phospholipase family protein [Pyrinomonadaceae bacterium]|nr:patatin-like phospholipase family protein [Pyrinomonadaceae bacterium]